jgi:hypothetical protein
MRRGSLTLAFLCPALLIAQSEARTDRLSFPLGGTLRLSKSIGELTIEGWDERAVEITTIKSVKIKGDSPPAAKSLDSIRVTAQQQGGDIVVTTEFPKHFTLFRPFTGLSDFELEYRIKAPREARLVIEHEIGEVHIGGMTGDIRATDGMGQITVAVPPGYSYALDTRSKLGSVYSQLQGQERKRLKFGHTLAGQANSKQLYLRIGFGDITIGD